MSYVSHANAMLTPEGRLKLVLKDGWTQDRAAERLQDSRAAVFRWVSTGLWVGTAGIRNKKKHVPIGYSFLHSAIDDHSRVVHSEILTDEKQETAAAFSVRANAFSASQGIAVIRVMTHHGSCYRSRCFNYALGQALAEADWTPPLRRREGAVPF